jgi:hypothetical protein
MAARRRAPRMLIGFYFQKRVRKEFVPSTVQGGKGFVWVALGRSVF